MLSMRTALLLPAALLVFGCATQTGPAGSEDAQPGGTAGAGEPVDITDAVLTSRSANCADYADAYVASVTDVQRGTDFAAHLTVVGDGSACEFASNAIPNHDFNATGHFATPVRAQTQTYRIPANPRIAATPTSLSLRMDAGVFLNGVKLDPLAAGCWGVGDGNIGCNDMSAPYRYDPLGTSHRFGADEHNAHTQPDGTYHYHGDPHALFDASASTTPSPVIGFAADGFPIFGSYFRDSQGRVRRARSSYRLKPGVRTGGPGGAFDGTFVDDWQFVEGEGDLDVCNGMTVDGVYGYFVSAGYPYVIGCFSGTPDDSFRK